MKIIRKVLAQSAKRIAGNRLRVIKLVHAAAGKAARDENVLGKVRDDFLTLLSLVRSWAKGEYPSPPWKSILLAVGAILYFVSPIDVIADFIPGGLLDDAAVILLVLKSLKTDIDAYRKWQHEQPIPAESRPASG